MRITSLRLQNFRGVEDRTVTFADGVTIVEGDNEAGKSSLTEALRLLRTVPDRSRMKAIRDVQPIGTDLAPKVTLVGESGPYAFTYQKQWLRTPSTELALTKPQHERLYGAQAVEKFDKILETTLDLDLLDALEIVQGKALDQPSLGSIRAVRSALANAEKADSGSGETPDAVTGDSLKQGDQLMSLVEAEHERYYTKTGIARAELKQARDDLQKAQKREAEAKAASSEMGQLKEDYEDLGREKVRIDGQAGEASNKLRDLQKVQAAIDTVTAEVDSAKQNQIALEARAKYAEALLKQQADLVAQVTDLEERKKVLGDGLAESKGSLETSEARHTEKKEVEQKAQSALSGAQAAKDEATLAATRLKETAELFRLQERKSRLDEAYKTRAKAREDLERLVVDDEVLERLRDLQTKVAGARSALEAATATVKVESLGADQVIIEGKEVRDFPEERLVTEPLAVEVPDQVRVTVSPPKDAGAYEDDLRDAEEQLNTRLKEAGVGSVVEAVQHNAARQTAQTEAKIADGLIRDLTEELSAQDLADRIATLTSRIGDVPDAAPTASELEAAQWELDAAGEKERAAAEAHAAATEQLAAAAKSVQEAEAQVGREKALFDQVTEQLSQAKVRAGEAKLSLEDLQTKSDEAAQAAKVGQENLEAAKEALAGLNPEVTAREVRHVTGLVDRYSREQREISDRRVETKALLDRLGSKGLYDEEIEAKAMARTAKRWADRVEKRAAAVALLRETLTRHQKEAQARYVRPLEETIRDLGIPVFGPDFRVRVNEDLEIESRLLESKQVPFASLSAGAREQLSVLGRLAAAILVAEEEGAPLMLDDTLGFSDPGRLEALGMVLSEVGSKAQVVVLTCQPDRYSAVAASKTVKI